MTKLPRRPGRSARPGPGAPGSATPPAWPGAVDAFPDEDDRSASGPHPGSSARSAAGGPAGSPGVPLDAAIEAALATSEVDAVTRVHLREASGWLGSRRSEGRSAGGARNLSEGLFAFVMPRLDHPEVLGVERQLAILEQLAEDLGAQDGDTVVREGALAVYRELRRLTLLRQHCYSLVEG